jgi:glucokinase
MRIGIDVGGTGIQVGLVNKDLQIISEASIPTRTDIPFEDQVREIASCVLSVIPSAGLSPDEIESVGVGIPGIASASGEIIKCTNMGWHHVPFAEVFRRIYNKPVFVDNDANVAALAESVAGVSAGTSSSVFITIGTGIGSGIIIDGRIWKGAHGIGGELGHVIFDLDGVPCSCGNHGCLERYCSATAIIRMGREAAKQHPDTLMMKLAENNPSNITAKIVFDAARQEDPVGVEVYHRFIGYLAQAVASVVNLIDPEVIVLGGGVSKAGTFLLRPLIREFPRYVLFDDQPLPEIKLAVLGSEAGIIGAAMLS